MGKDTKFGKAFEEMLDQHGLRQSQAAASLDVSRNYVSLVVKGDRKLKPDRIDEVSRTLGFSDEETRRLHRAAALDAGFRLDLPDDF